MLVFYCLLNVGTFTDLERGINIHNDTGSFQGCGAPGVKREGVYRSGVTASLILNLCTRWMWVVSFTN